MAQKKLFIYHNQMTKKIITLVLLSFTLHAQAQQKIPSYKKLMDDKSVNFYDLVRAAEKYFEQVNKEEKGSGWKDYQRWVAANEYKYYPDGNRAEEDPFFVTKQYQRFLAQQESTSNKLFPNGWKEVGPTTIDSITGHYSAGFGRLEDVYVDKNNPNIIYVGSRSGGFWKSTNGGNTWTGSSTDYLFATGVNTISASPTNPDSVLINLQNAQNEYSHGIYRSIDGGNNWTQTNFNPANIGQGGLGSNFKINEVSYHPRVSNLIFVATNNGIYRSSDNLQNWVRLYDNINITEIEFHPNNDSIIYLYSNNNPSNLLVSGDMGLSYSLSGVLTGNGSTTNVKISTSPACANCVYAANNNGVWKSTNAGQTFTFLVNPNENCDGFVVSDLDTSYMIYGYVDLERSTDGGQSFNCVTRWSLGNTNAAGNGHQLSYQNSTDYIHADLRNARCVNGVFYVTTDGLLAKSIDNGVNWIRLTDSMGIRENYRLGVSQSNHYKVVAGSQDNGTSFSTENGWVELYGADGMEAIVQPLNENWFIGSVQYGNRRRTIDGGKSTQNASPTGSADGDWIAPIAIDPNNQLSIFDFRDTVYRSDDFGDNHIKLGVPSTFSGDIKVAEIAHQNSNIIVIARNEKIEKSTDGGQTFTNIRGNLPAYSIMDIAIDPNNDDIIIAVFARYQQDFSKVWMTTTGGNSWTNITYNLGDMPIQSVVIDQYGNIYLGAEIGVFTKTMSSTNWSLYNTNLPNMAVRELEINHGSNTLKAATWGRGVWENALIGRENHPAIVFTSITNPPTTDKPKKTTEQVVTSRIAYDNVLSSVYTAWSANNTSLSNFIPMINTKDSTWVTTQPLPDLAVGTKIFFKVFAVGSNNDTSSSYQFMYVIQPFAYCQATGDTSAGNLFIQQVVLENINNTSNNDFYTYYNNPVSALWADSTYTINVTANTSWGENDYAAWIDFNNDADFTDDERVLWSIGPGVASVNNTFKVPVNVSNGDSVRMRVRLSYWGNEPKPCGTQFGEVEDYAISLRSNNWPLSIIAIKDKNQIANIYPNPTNGMIHVEFPTISNRDILLKNQLGQLIFKSQWFGKKNSLDLSKLTAGIYLLQIDDQVYKIVKGN